VADGLHVISPALGPSAVRPIDSSAIIRFSTGDVVDVALPTWRPLR
jgi:hypothetical protein